MRSRGFTLLEVMVGLAILAFGLVAIIGINGGTLRSHSYAKRLTIATLLAKSKMVDIESHFIQEGFTSDFDQTMEGNFSDEGWNDFRWKAEIVKPEIDAANTTALVSSLMERMAGDMETNQQDSSAPSPTMDFGSMLGSMQPLLEAQLTTLTETMKESLREVRLEVTWQDGAKVESIDVVTHLVILGGQGQAGGASNDPGAQPPGQPPGQPPAQPPGQPPSRLP